MKKKLDNVIIMSLLLSVICILILFGVNDFFVLAKIESCIHETLDEYNAEQENETEDIPEDMPEPGSLEYYKQMSHELDFIEIIDSSELTYDTLVNRDGNIIIEEIIGVCVNADGDGKVLNCNDESYDYISYRSVPGVREGTVVLTYCIYNPDSIAEDDIIMRYDYIIDTENED